MSIHKKFKSLVSSSNANILNILDKIGVNNSTNYRYANGISDMRSESFVKILKELGIDVERMITQRVNEHLGETGPETRLGDDFEQIFQELSRTNKMTLLDTMISDAQKLNISSLQGPLARLREYKKRLKGRRINASGGNRR